MHVTIKGKGNFTLNKTDFVASGGEGSIYKKVDTAFKIYADPKNMVHPAKIGELSVLTMPNIIRPQDIVLDSKGTPVGYTMDYVKDTYALCQLFPKVFRDRFRIKAQQVVDLVSRLREIVEHAHASDILIVDLNELNFLMSDTFTQVYAIDCDSWQTKSFHATAIMDSIRDRHATGPGDKYNPNQGTDWFSFAVVSFQMYIGIHPYKGSHPKIKSMDERMLKNVSVLNKDVSYPPVCQPLTSIPQTYLDWFKAVLEKGDRCAPPTSLHPVVTVVPQVVRIAGSKNFNVRKVLELPDDIVRFDFETQLAVTSAAVYSLNGKSEFDLLGMSQTPTLGVSQKGKSVAAWVEMGKLKLHDITRGQRIDCDILCESVMSCAGNIYGKSSDKVFQVLLMEPSDFMIATHVAGRISPIATKVFDGAVFQDLLGACYASIFPVSKNCFQVHLKELDGWRIIDAKYESHVLMVVAGKDGKYDKFIFRLNDDFDEYDVRKEKDTGPVALNFTVMPGTGVCLHLNQNDELELFSNRNGSTQMKVFDDPALSGDMRLAHDGTKAMFSKGNHLYSFEVKKP